MPFTPLDLLEHQVLPPKGVPTNLEIFSRVGLLKDAPEAGRAEYMDAADAWVSENDGKLFYPETGGTYYGLPRGRVPSR